MYFTKAQCTAALLMTNSSFESSNKLAVEMIFCCCDIHKKKKQRMVKGKFMLSNHIGPKNKKHSVWTCICIQMARGHQ